MAKHLVVGEGDRVHLLTHTSYSDATYKWLHSWSGDDKNAGGMWFEFDSDSV